MRNPSKQDILRAAKKLGIEMEINYGKSGFLYSDGTFEELEFPDFNDFFPCDETFHHQN